MPILPASFALVLGSAVLLLSNVQEQVDAARKELRGLEALHDLQQAMIDLRRADDALYLAKDFGRNRVEIGV